MEINIIPSPDYEAHAMDQALMEVYRLLIERGRKIRMENQASFTPTQENSSNSLNPGDAHVVDRS